MNIHQAIEKFKEGHPVYFIYGPAVVFRLEWAAGHPRINCNLGLEGLSIYFLGNVNDAVQAYNQASISDQWEYTPC